jgi:hypothetical protein
MTQADREEEKHRGLERQELTELQRQEEIAHWMSQVDLLRAQLLEFKKFLADAQTCHVSERAWQRAWGNLGAAQDALDMYQGIDDLHDAVVDHSKWVDHRTLLEKVFGPGEE